MLPPGHIAGGFLTAEALLKIIHPQLPQAQINRLLLWGMFFGFAPDLDTFYSFLKEKAFTVRKPQNNHRHFLSHAPILWLVAGLLIYFCSSSEYVKLIGLLVWLASWSHFLLDSIEFGIMWLWPFSRKQYALKSINIEVLDKKFLGYWMDFLKIYSKRWSFYLELVVIVLALIVYFH
jgi:membrane-bound metal-dependent hydrolase YbcI (DUF457 family)